MGLPLSPGLKPRCRNRVRHYRASLTILAFAGSEEVTTQVRLGRHISRPKLVPSAQVYDGVKEMRDS